MESKQKLTEELIRKWCKQAKRWTLSSVQEFTHCTWTLQLRRLSKKHYPYQFELSGYSEYSSSLMVQRYKTIEDALLAVANRFNLQNWVCRYVTIEDVLKAFSKYEEFRETPCNTQIVYFSRNENGFPVEHWAVLRGALTEEQEQNIWSCLEQGKYFVPVQLGINLTPDDKQWCEWGKMYSLTHCNPTVNVSVDTLVKRFQRLKHGWRTNTVSRDGTNPYVCSVSEKRARTIIVWAKNHHEAEMRAEELMRDGVVEMQAPEYCIEHNTDCIGFASASDINAKPMYRK